MHEQESYVMNTYSTAPSHQTLVFTNNQDSILSYLPPSSGSQILNPQQQSSSIKVVTKSPMHSPAPPTQMRLARNASIQQLQHQQQQQQQQYSQTQQSVSKPYYTHLSAIEAAILRSNVPIEINGSTEEIVINGQRGILANRDEIANWRGSLPISQYDINQDANPEVISKRTGQELEYIQELAIRYLRPPTPPPPGEIIIKQEANQIIQPGPPVVLRQQPPRPLTPEPLVIREAPPIPPAQVGRKVITISGRAVPPPPRKVIVERLPPLPNKPQAILVERWLPYALPKRRVIYQRVSQPEPVMMKPKNVIVQWEPPQVKIKREFKYLGVVNANPAEYVARYGQTLKTSQEIPDFVRKIKPPNGMVLAADSVQRTIYELEGDVGALKLVDLDSEGLGEYRDQVYSNAKPTIKIVSPSGQENHISFHSHATQTSSNQMNVAPAASAAAASPHKTNIIYI